MHVCTEKRPKFQPKVGEASYRKLSICTCGALARGGGVEGDRNVNKKIHSEAFDTYYLCKLHATINLGLQKTRYFTYNRN